MLRSHPHKSHIHFKSLSDYISFRCSLSSFDSNESISLPVVFECVSIFVIFLRHLTSVLLCYGNECIRLFVLICLLCSSYIQLDLRAECRGYQNFIFCLSKSFHIFRGVLKSIHHHVYRFYPVNDHF